MSNQVGVDSLKQFDQGFRLLQVLLDMKEEGRFHPALLRLQRGRPRTAVFDSETYGKSMGFWGAHGAPILSQTHMEVSDHPKLAGSEWDILGDRAL